MSRSSASILDIRRSKFDESIPNQVVQGLKSQPKTLPALLFYSTEGIRHWNRHSQASDFYPRKEEIYILEKKAQEIAASARDQSVIVDFGTLEAEQKSITYYALDLSFEELESTIHAIPQNKFHYVNIKGLHGTFEDGLHWLKETPSIRDLPHILLLLGLTIGNFSRPNAAKFLLSIAQHAMTRNAENSSIILTLDSCKVPTKVLRAYNADGVVPFALESLNYGNFLLQQESSREKRQVFNLCEWHYLSEWNFVDGRHEASLIPSSKDIRLGSPLDEIVIRQDEKVRFGCSYKYDCLERNELFSAAGLREVAVWSQEGCDVAFYCLKLPVG
ncbi:EasF [Penicillium lagena]|uniref:EasF n=1 Tax=Penicillium lagena TaxID=94218 RepID=UPI002540A497|nr:EasF [Penicillium lagena]KAJ5612600.1 EasF [Penicillium lagena]